MVDSSRRNAVALVQIFPEAVFPQTSLALRKHVLLTLKQVFLVGIIALSKTNISAIYYIHTCTKMEKYHLSNRNVVIVEQKNDPNHVVFRYLFALQIRKDLLNGRYVFIRQKITKY